MVRTKTTGRVTGEPQTSRLSFKKDVRCKYCGHDRVWNKGTFLQCCKCIRRWKNVS